MPYDATTGECLVFTYKDGLLSRVGHDLKLRCDAFTVDLGESAVDARFDVSAFTCLSAMKGGREKPGTLSDKDKRQIIQNMHKDVLDPRRHPEVHFHSDDVSREGNALKVKGELTLNGRTRPLTATARRVAGRWVAEVELDQTDYGIKPFSALMGTLKVKPRVKVRVTLPAE